MPSFLTGKLGLWAAGAAAVAFVGLVLWVLVLKNQLLSAEHELEVTKAELVVVKEVNERNLKTIRQLQDEARRLGDIIQEAENRITAVNEQLQDAMEDIANAPESENGPAAPVLQRTIERVLERAAGGADAGDSP